MLCFQQYQPSEALRPYVHSFWTLEYEAADSTTNTAFRFVPDACPEWMFHLGSTAGIRFKNGSGMQHSAAHFLGHFTGHLDLHMPTAGSHIFGIKFYPWAAHQLWEGTMHQYTDAVTDMSALSADHRQLSEQLQAGGTK